jgi:hypothetical protein
MQEIYFLRTYISSNHSAGKKSCDDIWTVLDVPYGTYRERCVALGFLYDENEWDLSMTESAAYAMPSQIRATFVILLVFNEVGHPPGLFDKHYRVIGENVVHRLSSEEHPLSDEHLMILLLVDINMRLEARKTTQKLTESPLIAWSRFLEK